VLYFIFFLVFKRKNSNSFFFFFFEIGKEHTVAQKGLANTTTTFCINPPPFIYGTWKLLSFAKILPDSVGFSKPRHNRQQQVESG
jgi:hypothetical protein